jgi:hypothetical protein
MTTLKKTGLELLAKTVNQFKPSEQTAPFLIPENATYLHELLENIAIEEDADGEQFAEFSDQFPWEAEEETLISMQWQNSSDTLTVIELPDNVRLYVEYLFGLDGGTTRLLGSVVTNTPRETDHRFLQRFFETNGDAFDTMIIISPPLYISPSSITSWSFLFHIFYTAFESAGSEAIGEMMSTYEVWDDSRDNPYLVPSRASEEQEEVEDYEPNWIEPLPEDHEAPENLRLMVKRYLAQAVTDGLETM